MARDGFGNGTGANSKTSAKTFNLRPCGGRAVLRMAVPLLVSTGAWTVMNFIDRMFLLRYSEVAMAAVLPAGMVHFVMV